VRTCRCAWQIPSPATRVPPRHDADARGRRRKNTCDDRRQNFIIFARSLAEDLEASLKTKARKTADDAEPQENHCADIAAFAAPVLGDEFLNEQPQPGGGEASPDNAAECREIADNRLAQIPSAAETIRGSYPRPALRICQSSGAGRTASTSSAARKPLSQAPCTVEKKVGCVASPAKKSRSATGAASTARAPACPGSACE
jgi:hypothetical protein